MKLSEFKKILVNQDKIEIELPNGKLVPSHFHVTEIGEINKRFIDCGGTLRNENVVNFQLWEANDYDHRLHPEKLINVIELSERKLDIKDEEIEVEYQGNTIEKYGLEYNGNRFILSSKTTDCLAKDNCGIPDLKIAKPLASLSPNSCAPGSGCC